MFILALFLEDNTYKYKSKFEHEQVFNTAFPWT